MNKQQLSFFLNSPNRQDLAKSRRLTHGGIRQKGRRKGRRPLIEKKWTHLVLKSAKATGRQSFLAMRNRDFIRALLHAKARKWDVQLAEFVNVGNHLHLKVRFRRRESFQKFLKSITGLIARHVTGAKRGNPQGPFWQGLAFTRVLKTSLEELQLRGYFEANRLEARKGPEARRKFLARFNQWVARLRKSAGAQPLAPA